MRQQPSYTEGDILRSKDDGKLWQIKEFVWGDSNWLDRYILEIVSGQGDSRCSRDTVAVKHIKEFYAKPHRKCLNGAV